MVFIRIHSFFQDLMTLMRGDQGIKLRARFPERPQEATKEGNEWSLSKLLATRRVPQLNVLQTGNVTTQQFLFMIHDPSAKADIQDHHHGESDHAPHRD